MQGKLCFSLTVSYHFYGSFITFPGSFGLTKKYEFVDYWTLRERSYQLFVDNIYARGLIRRLLRNEIHTGIVGSASIVSDVLWPNMEEQEREEKGVIFSEMLTQFFELYSKNKDVFDWRKEKTFGDFQEQVRLESLICVVFGVDFGAFLPLYAR